MKRAPQKTKRDFSIVTSGSQPDLPRFKEMEEHEGFRVGEKVWFNTSLVGEKYSWGMIKEIREQSSGKIALTVWDELKGMWRAFSVERLFREKPIKERKSRRKE